MLDSDEVLGQRYSPRRLPWSVRLALDAAAGRRVDEPPPRPPPSGRRRWSTGPAAGAAFELVRRTELLLDRWGTHPPAALQGRWPRRTRPARHGEPCCTSSRDVAALVVETAAAAGLLDQGMTDDARRRLAAHGRLRRLAGAPRRPSAGPCSPAPGCTSPRLVSAVGGRIGDKPVNALSPDLPRSWLVALRHDVLAELRRPADRTGRSPPAPAPPP